MSKELIKSFFVEVYPHLPCDTGHNAADREITYALSGARKAMNEGTIESQQEAISVLLSDVVPHIKTEARLLPTVTQIVEQMRDVQKAIDERINAACRAHWDKYMPNKEVTNEVRTSRPLRP